MPRKKRAPSRNPARPPVAGQAPRDAALVLRMVNACEEALELHYSRDNIALLLGSIAKPKLNPGDPTPAPIPSRTLDDYIARVRRRWEETAAGNVKEAKRAFIRRQFSHIRRAVQKGNLSAVVRHEKLLGDTQGVFAPVRIEASTPPGQPIEVAIRDPRKMTSAERRKRLAELEAKRQVTLSATVAVAKPETTEQG